MKRALVTLYACLSVLMTYSQLEFPLGGMSVEEIPIPQLELNLIEAEIGPGVHCYRIYACMDDPWWELQALYGDYTGDWSLTLEGEVYQDPMGGPMALNVNPLLFDLFPALQYDSWYTIGLENNESQTLYADAGVDPLALFESGQEFLENTYDGAIIAGFWLPPNSEGSPDENGRVLVSQITTNGNFEMSFCFQFRKLNSDGTVFEPITANQSLSVSIAGGPDFGNVECDPAYKLGCTDSTACNYNELATHDDGSCLEFCCPGDFNGDFLVTTADLLIFLPEYGCTDICATDLDGDGDVDTSDALILLSALGEACE